MERDNTFYYMKWFTALISFSHTKELFTQEVYHVQRDSVYLSGAHLSECGGHSYESKDTRIVSTFL